MLSGDLATLLTGRYVEIKMLPLSFKEFSEARGDASEKAFSEYLAVGGLPYIASMDQNTEKLNTYLEGIYNTVIIKDIEERQSRKESDPSKRRVSNIALLKSIAKFLASVVGSPISIRSVTDYLISNGRKVSPNTVDNYIEALCESCLLYTSLPVVDKEEGYTTKTNLNYGYLNIGSAKQPKAEFIGDMFASELLTGNRKNEKISDEDGFFKRQVIRFGRRNYAFAVFAE